MSKPWKDLPAWFSLVVAAVTILCSAGATYATTGFRLSALERRVDLIEKAEDTNRTDFNNLRDAVTEMRTNIQWIRDAIATERRK